MIGVTDLLARVDVDEDCHGWSLLSCASPNACFCDHAFGSRSNIDDSDTFKTLQMPNSLAALTRFCPASYF
jgi:hypothetical protein